MTSAIYRASVEGTGETLKREAFYTVFICTLVDRPPPPAWHHYNTQAPSVLYNLSIISSAITAVFNTPYRDFLAGTTSSSMSPGWQSTNAPKIKTHGTHANINLYNGCVCYCHVYPGVMNWPYGAHHGVADQPGQTSHNSSVFSALCVESLCRWEGLGVRLYWGRRASVYFLFWVRIQEHEVLDGVMWRWHLF